MLIVIVYVDANRCVCVCQSIFWTLSDAPKTEKQGPVVTLLCTDSCMVSWRRLVGNLRQTSRSMTVGFRKKGKASTRCFSWNSEGGKSAGFFPANRIHSIRGQFLPTKLTFIFCWIHPKDPESTSVFSKLGETMGGSSENQSLARHWKKDWISHRKKPPPSRELRSLYLRGGTMNFWWRDFLIPVPKPTQLIRHYLTCVFGHPNWAVTNSPELFFMFFWGNYTTQKI